MHGGWHPGAGTAQGVEVVNALLTVAAFPDDDVCLMSLNFWHRLSRYLTDDASRSSDGALASDLR